MRNRYRLAGGLWAVGMLSAGFTVGCAKHRWLADEGRRDPRMNTAARSAATSAESTVAFVGAGEYLPESRVQTRGEARPDDARTGESHRDRLDPVTSGGLPLASEQERVSEELPWPEPPAPENASVVKDAAAVCAPGPCYWVQVAAKLDSLGCGQLMTHARRIAAAGAIAPGGEIVRDQDLWKVRVGPYADWRAADLARRRLREGGFPEAWLVRR